METNGPTGENEMSRFQLHVIEPSSPHSDCLAEIVRRMQERFRTPEQFEMQIDTICLDIAEAMRGTMDHLGSYFRHGDVLVFNFTYLPQERIVQLLERQSTDPHPCPSH
jgi:hypothetical protein